MNPNYDVCKLVFNPDVEFSGMHGHELPTYPECVKIRTGFVITFADCPVYWKYKFQAETALSTIESEINVLSHSFRELLPIIDITKSIGQAVELTICDTTMNVTPHIEKFQPPSSIKIENNFNENINY